MNELEHYIGEAQRYRRISETRKKIVVMYREHIADLEAENKKDVNEYLEILHTKEHKIEQLERQLTEAQAQLVDSIPRTMCFHHSCDECTAQHFPGGRYARCTAPCPRKGGRR